MLIWMLVDTKITPCLVIRNTSVWELGTVPKTSAVYILSAQQPPSIFQVLIDTGGLSIEERSIVEIVVYSPRYIIN